MKNATEAYTRHPNTVCSFCKASVYKRPGEIKKGPVFCSKICYGKACRKSHNCPVCGKEVLSGKNARTCSQACANKGRTGIKYGTGEKNGKAKRNQRIKKLLLSERGPKCERCGYDNIFVLDAHHKIERCKGGTDDLSNLFLLCRNCHGTEHLGDSRTEEQANWRWHPV